MKSCVDVRPAGAGLTPVYTMSTLLSQEPQYAISLSPMEELDTDSWKGSSLAHPVLSCTLHET